MFKRGLICLALATLAFSTMELVGKMVSTSLHPFQITFWRFVIGALVLLPFALVEIKKRKLHFQVKDYIYFIGLGLLCIVICMSFFQVAILYTQASTVAVVFCANPVFTIPFAYFILKEEINRYTFLSLMLGLSGVLVIMQPFSADTFFEIKGIVLAFLASITWSLYTVIGKKGIVKYGGIIQNCFSFIAGNIGLLLLLYILKIPLVSGLGPSNLLHMLYLGIFVSGLGFLFYFQGMGFTSASMGSLVFFIKPALATLLSSILIHEQLSRELLLGIILIIAGSICMLAAKSVLSSSSLPSTSPKKKVFFGNFLE